jgi:polar amino acid transport system substrate-binding protein
MGKHTGSFMRTTVLLLLATVCLLAFSPAHDTHAAGQVVHVVTLNGYAPYCFTYPPSRIVSGETIPPGKDSRYLQGYSWDVVRESLHSQGLTIVLNVAPWARAMAQLKEGKAELLFPAGENKIRRKLYAYSEMPVNTARMLIYTRSDSTLNWNGLKQLNNVTIAALRGFNYGDQWNELDPLRVNKYAVNTIRTGFKMLRAGHVDGFIGYEANWDHAIRALGWHGQFVKQPVFHEAKEYCITLLENVGAQSYLRDFDRGMEILKENGTLEVLRKRWDIPEQPTIH